MKIDHKSGFTSQVQLQERLRAEGCEVFEAGTAGYEQSTRLWNAAVINGPALVARCLTVSDVQSCLRVAKNYQTPFSIRGRGQDWVGRSLRDGGFVLDLSRMRSVSVNPDASEATIAGGASASDVSVALNSSHLVAVTGNAGAIGMAGLITGGGYGPLTTRFGLASDSLRSAEVVLADGRVVQADNDKNADLFWALRGGGGNFGVVTSMRLGLHAPGAIMSGTILFPWKDAKSVLHGYGEIMSSAPDELSLAAAMSAGPDGRSVIILAPTWTGDVESGNRLISRLQGFGSPLITKFAPTTFNEILAFADAHLPEGRNYEVRTRWFGDLSPDVISMLVAAYESKTSPLTKVVLHHFHGAGARIAPDATAFGMRQEHFTLLIYSAWETGQGQDSVHRNWAAGLSARLKPFALPGGYANLLAPDNYEQTRAAYGDNGDRLRELKGKFDPEDVFSSAIPLPA